MVVPEKALLRPKPERGNRKKSGEELIKEAEPKVPKEAQELLEVHSGGTEDGVDGIALRPFEPVAFEAVFALEVTDGGFDGGAAFHPSPERLRGRAPAAFVDMHLLGSAVIVSAIAHVDMRFRR